MIRASSLPRLSRCPASAVIKPQVHEESVASVEGTARHAFLANVATFGRDKALELVAPEHREMCAAIEIPAFNGEVFIERRVEWRGIKGTLDVGGILPDGGVFVADYKGAHAVVDRAADNLQLGLYALALIHEFNQPLRAVIVIARILDDGGVIYDRADLDATKVMDLAKRIIRVQEMVEASDGTTVVMGPWCRYCPAWRACPANTGPLVVLAPDVPVLPEQVIAVHDRVKAVERILEDAKRAIRVHLEHGPVTVGNRTLSLVDQSRRSIDGEAAFPVLIEMLGEEGARAACEIKTSFAAIEKAVKAPRGEKKGRLAAIEAALTSAGAVSETTFKKVEETKTEDK